MAGDRQEITLGIGSGARVVWTTQSYEKIHKMPPEAWAERNCRIVLEGGAFLDYSPLPVIPFADSDYRAATYIDMADHSAALVCRELFCAGRIARGELFRFRRYRHLLELRLGGRLLFRENTDLRPSEQGGDAALNGIGFFEGHSHSLTMVFRLPGLNQEEIRRKLQCRSSITAALTALEEGAFLVRALGHSAEELQGLGEELALPGAPRSTSPANTNTP
jgi:urease accessory protein